MKCYARGAGGESLPLVEEKFEKTSTLPVSRGLYVLRYIESLDPVSPAVATVRAGAAGGDVVEILSAPGVSNGQLNRPGSAVAIKVSADSELVIGIKKGPGGSTLEASLRLELLFQGEAVSATSSATTSQGGGRAGLSLLAHVSMRGDMEVGEGEWMAGPQAPSPIEGIEVRGGDSSEVVVETQVLMSTRPPRWSPWVTQGEFAGSRGRSLPLSGVRFRLTGADSRKYEIVAEAAFLGAPVKMQKGSEIELFSNSGTDPLVGLRLSLEKLVSGGEIQSRAGEIAGRRPRVQVFKAASRS